MSTDREHVLTQAFVSIANSLVDGVDAVELLSGLATDCARLLDIASAGLLLADGHGVLHLIAASSERTRDLELFQLQREQGPCLDCYATGAPVIVDDLTAEVKRWPVFVPVATAAGFASVHAMPLRLRDTVLGALNLFGNEVGPLAADDLDLAQALAHVASIALVADKAASDKEAINQQLQKALASRIGIEQAKGIVAQRGNIDMEQAFAVIRNYARSHHAGLSDIAKQVVSRELPAAQVIEHGRTKAGARPSGPPGS
jgi:transcriptional regulator with GAF, ATPase, and Fis domain